MINTAILTELLSSYETEAFRLETLPIYTVPQEQEGFDHFLRTRKVQGNSDVTAYITEHTEKIKEGKAHIRARVIPNPLTDYFVYETHIGYIPQEQAGFTLCFLEDDEFHDTILSYFGGTTDFRLFDKKHLVAMKYDDRGSFLGVEKIDNTVEIDRALAIRDAIMENAHPLKYVLDTYREIKRAIS